MNDLHEKVLQILAEICQTKEVLRNPEIDLFDIGLLDSFGVIELLLALETGLNIQVPITDFDRTVWNTPNRIILKLGDYV